MADEQNCQHHQAEKMKTEEPAAPPMESTDRGLFDFGKKKEESKPQEEVIVTDFEKVQISEAEEKKHGIGGGVLEKLHRVDSSSSSSSSDEEGADEEKKRRRKERKEKKGLKEKLKEKIPGHKKEGEEKKHEEDTAVPIEKCEEEKEKIHVEEAVYSEPSHPEEKKGILGKIKDKLPGHQKKTEDVPSPAAAPVPPADLGPGTGV
uniref:Dehydrin n=1 Tax=Tamarix hispida TaxID=189793 RepID=C0KTL3_9CARY|nr:dehydrin [Tamarix hispida]